MQCRNVVHMRFFPSNIVILKNNLIKLFNFSHAQVLKDTINNYYTEFIEEDEYMDPYFKETNKYGFYTDIFSFGMILQRLY